MEKVKIKKPWGAKKVRSGCKVKGSWWKRNKKKGMRMNGR